MDDDVSHAVDARLTALEEKVGIGQEETEENGDNGDDLVQEVDAEEEAD